MRILMNHPQVELAHLTARSLPENYLSIFRYSPVVKNKTFVEMDLTRLKK